jgi:hypothetical protein
MLEGWTMNTDTMDMNQFAGTLIYKSPEYKILYLLKSGLVEFEGVKLS